MERNSEGGKFHWPKIWAVPLVITLAGAIVFAAAFKTPHAADFQPRPSATGGGTRTNLGVRSF